MALDSRMLISVVLVDLVVEVRCRLLVRLSRRVSAGVPPARGSFGRGRGVVDQRPVGGGGLHSGPSPWQGEPAPRGDHHQGLPRRGARSVVLGVAGWGQTPPTSGATTLLLEPGRRLYRPCSRCRRTQSAAITPRRTRPRAHPQRRRPIPRSSSSMPANSRYNAGLNICLYISSTGRPQFCRVHAGHPALFRRSGRVAGRNLPSRPPQIRT